MSHHCHALRCTESVPPRLLMCSRHWDMVPAQLQQQVLNRYRPGQERDKDPSMAYLEAAMAAVRAVADAEGL